jgi:NADH-quinone oxidoreductase subunit J
MDIKTALFYAFATILVMAAFRVITARNPVHAALFLVLSFFTAACLWMLLKAEFLAIALVLVYVGAVMVLFLFVVMMLDINTDKLREGFWRAFPIAAAVGIVIVAEIVAVIWQAFTVTQSLNPAANLPSNIDNTKALGIALYSTYAYPAQIAAVVLLVAIIAAIALTLRSRKDSRHQDASAQIRVQAKDRVRIVKMAPTIQAPKVEDKPNA